jgi:hypothetical protein
VTPAGASLAGQIQARIVAFLASDAPRLESLTQAVREHEFLPLYLGWIAALGIRPDGSFVYFEYEPVPKPVRPLEESFWQRMAILQGAKEYPELRALLPERPAIATTCSSCHGAGELAGLPQLICGCGGLGWVIPGEAREENPG